MPGARTLRALHILRLVLPVRTRPVAPALLAAGIGPDQIPDEQAEQQPDGSLMIYVEAGGRRLGMGVPRGHWRWMRRE